MPNEWYIQGTNPVWNVNTNWTALVGGGGGSPTDPPWTTADTISDRLHVGSTFSGSLTVDTPLGDYDSIGIAPANGECLVSSVVFGANVNGGKFDGGVYEIVSGARVSNATLEDGTVNVTNGTIINGDICNTPVRVGILGVLGVAAVGNGTSKQGPLLSGNSPIYNSGTIYYAATQSDDGSPITGYNYGTIWDIDYGCDYLISSGIIYNGRFGYPCQISNSGSLYGANCYIVNNYGLVNGATVSSTVNQYKGSVINSSTDALNLYGGYIRNIHGNSLTLNGGAISGQGNASTESVFKESVYITSGNGRGISTEGFVYVDGPNAVITDGNFKRIAIIISSGVVSGGVFNGDVTVGENGVSMGRVSGGTFLGTLTVDSSDSVVASGQFLGTAVSNRGTIQHDLTIWGNPTYTRLGTGVCLARRPCDAVGSF